MAGFFARLSWLAWLFFAGLGRAEPPVHFSREILPILSDNCFQCHGPDEGSRKAGLRLDTREGATAKNQDGVAAIAPGNSAASELLRRVLTTDPEEIMPPPKTKRALQPEQIRLLRRWIEEGAPWGKHWALEPPRREPLPPVRGGNWTSSALDRFVLARLEAEHLTPSDAAAKATLIRRLSLDLRGLSPAVEEVDEFLAESSPNAVERLADRFLASPQFGERMAWDWLDAARYADSNGYQGDGERTMWPWRDWVASAFNDNLPFDQFSLWQIAGDLLPGATVEQRLATGFCRNHMINGEGGRIPAENRVDYVMDMSETVGTTWLGLTLNCCRCHDHKFDALSQREYYQLYAFFNQTPVDGSGGNPQTPPVLEMPSAEQVARGQVLAIEAKDLAKALEEQERAIQPGPGEVREIFALAPAKRSVAQLDKLIAQAQGKESWAKNLRALRNLADQQKQHERSVPRVMIMEDRPEPRETFVLFKGLYDNPTTTKVHAGVPASLPPLASEGTPNRLGLARWIVAPENPLAARVIINRFWQQFFGLGLVKTAEDFGIQGEKPSHSELLDRLATEFVASGWDVKRFCRGLVTSATYQQTSRATPARQERDPANRLLGRGARFRLPAWMLRDQALAVSGLLVRDLGGPPVNPYQPSGVWEETTFGNKRYTQDHGASLYRRSFYIFWRRIVAPTLFFDNASRQTCTVKQSRTNTPLQALTTLNDVTYVEAARVLAEEVMRAVDGPARLGQAFRRVLARLPSEEEKARLLPAVERYRAKFATDEEAAQKLLAVGEWPRDARLNAAEHAAWTVICNTILNLDEALSKE